MATMAKPKRTSTSPTTNGLVEELPTADEVTDPPPALNGQPSFGRTSFAFYIINIAVTLLVWPLNLFLGGGRPWQKRGRILMACTKAFATTTNAIAAGLLASGMSWVARHTTKDNASADSFTDQDNTPIMPSTDFASSLANNLLTPRAAPNATSPVNATMPAISTGTTASSLVWISVTTTTKPR
ncbi:hypothetical protein Sste5346_004624 [Sporothrix stenoceras]|uniref:Integral membrane protein n=1 Tax=Sporothrix stenoceras TaxID=5173 RepID=A0ABR3Z7F7_9PEZI